MVIHSTWLVPDKQPEVHLERLKKNLRSISLDETG